MDVERLKKGLLLKEFTSVDLVNIFGSRCQSIGRHLCLTAEENFEAALEMARTKDAEREEARARGGEDAVRGLGELHGVPVSIKDTINMKGFLTTYGCAFLCAEEFRAKEDASVVTFYLRAGAIPIVRGNVP